MPYVIQVVSLGSDYFDQLEAVVGDLNSIQKEFLFSLPAARWRGELVNTAPQARYLNTDVWSILRKYREDAKGHLPYVVAFVDKPLSSASLQNLFGSTEAEEGLAVVTIVDRASYVTSFRAFCAYYLTRYALGFMAPALRSHPDTRSCLFDKKICKTDLKLSLRSGRLCDDCLPIIRQRFNTEIERAIDLMTRYIRDQEVATDAELDVRPLDSVAVVKVLLSTLLAEGRLLRALEFGERFPGAHHLLPTMVDEEIIEIWNDRLFVLPKGIALAPDAFRGKLVSWVDSLTPLLRKLAKERPNREWSTAELSARSEGGLGDAQIRIGMAYRQKVLGGTRGIYRIDDATGLPDAIGMYLAPLTGPSLRELVARSDANDPRRRALSAKHDAQEQRRAIADLVRVIVDHGYASHEWIDSIVAALPAHFRATLPYAAAPRARLEQIFSCVLEASPLTDGQHPLEILVLRLELEPLQAIVDASNRVRVTVRVAIDVSSASTAPDSVPPQSSQEMASSQIPDEPVPPNRMSRYWDATDPTETPRAVPTFVFLWLVWTLLAVALTAPGVVVASTWRDSLPLSLPVAAAVAWMVGIYILWRQSDSLGLLAWNLYGATIQSQALWTVLYGVTILLLAICSITLIRLSILETKEWDTLVGTTTYVSALKAGMCWAAGLILAIVSVRALWEMRVARHRLEARVQRRQPTFVRPVTVAHLSDLHLVGDSLSKTMEGEVGTNQAFASVLRAIETRESEIDVVLLTGDVTDAGERDEWNVFFGAFLALPPRVQRKFVLLPGNHDINICGRSKYFSVDKPGSALRAMRLTRMLGAMHAVQGERMWCVRTFTDRPNTTANRLTLCAELVDSQLGSGPVTEQFWEDLFPCVVEVRLSDGGKVRVVLLDSNRPSAWLLSNAFGRISNSALSRLDALLRDDWYDTKSLYAVHHHLLRPTDETRPKERAKLLFMVMEEPDALLNLLNREKGAVVFHGHRHVTRHSQDRRTDATVVGAPSSTLGNCRDVPPVPGFYLVKIASDGSVSRDWIDVERPVLAVGVTEVPRQAIRWARVASFVAVFVLVTAIVLVALWSATGFVADPRSEKGDHHGAGDAALASGRGGTDAESAAPWDGDVATSLIGDSASVADAAGDAASRPSVNVSVDRSVKVPSEYPDPVRASVAAARRLAAGAAHEACPHIDVQPSELAGDDGNVLTLICRCQGAAAVTRPILVRRGPDGAFLLDANTRTRIESTSRELSCP